MKIENLKTEIELLEQVLKQKKEELKKLMDKQIFDITINFTPKNNVTILDKNENPINKRVLKGYLNLKKENLSRTQAVDFLLNFEDGLESLIFKKTNGQLSQKDIKNRLEFLIIIEEIRVGLHHGAYINRTYCNKNTIKITSHYLL
jgi:hypothetical protein